MTPKEKAIELVNRFQNEVGMFSNQDKQCALIAVDELFDYNSKESMHDYWIEVKQEIEKL